ncbi:hypothetical protein D3C84_1111840 [compost metagenome]
MAGIRDVPDHLLPDAAAIHPTVPARKTEGQAEDRRGAHYGAAAVLQHNDVDRYHIIEAEARMGACMDAWRLNCAVVFCTVVFHSYYRKYAGEADAPPSA